MAIADGGVRTGAAPMRIRLTRRGRITIFVGVLLLALLAVFGRAVASADAPATGTPVTVHVVVSGDTLWGIAQEATTAGHDVRDTMIEVRDLNRLSTSSLQVGQRLLLPAS